MTGGVPRPIRFVLVGLSGAAANVGALWLGTEAADLPLPAAGTLAIAFAVWSNFALNDVWTFRDERLGTPLWTRALAYHVAALPGAALNLGLLLALASWAGLHYLLANVIAIGLALALTHGVSAWLTLRPPAAGPRRAEPLATVRRVIVVVPTYNEAENVGRLIEAILSQGPQFEMLIVDDASPDGTGDLVAARARSEPRLHLVRREGKLGLGTAYVRGFQEALALEADLVVQMDADLSHDPRDLRRLVEAAREADVVIGSRYVAGGSTPGWPWYRHLVSGGAGLATRALLGIPVRDVTGGFKCWRRGVLERLALADVRCRGFAFQVEMNYLAWRGGYSIAEAPVTFVDRERGRSKMSLGITLEAAVLLWRLALGATTPRR
jgi:dolichol-phosphate mannosyltransferase